MQEIYLDHNATTPLLPAVWEAMRPLLGGKQGNPASPHCMGRRARQALEDAREKVASLLGAFPDEVVFTSGATEANNLAIFGLAQAIEDREAWSVERGASKAATPLTPDASRPTPHAPRILSSPIEHPSVLEPLRQLEHRGWRIDWLPVTRAGSVEAEALPRLLCPQTRLVAVMLANHETGALQPVEAMTASLPSGVAWHCDAVQGVGKVPVHFHELGVTTLSLSAHKFHGPTGIGALLVRRGTTMTPQLWGGPQQQGRRPGTEPVAQVVGLATALELAYAELSLRRAKLATLRQTFLKALRRDAEPVVLNGPFLDEREAWSVRREASQLAAADNAPRPTTHDPRLEEGLPHTLNLSFPGCPSESLLMNLDLAGVACSTGSACSSGSLLPSPVLRAMGVSEEDLHSAMRFSLGILLSEEEVTEAAHRIATVVKRLRREACGGP